MVQFYLAEARVANPTVAAKKTTKRGKGAVAAGVPSAAATKAELKEALAKEKLKAAKHLKVCQNRVRQAKRAITSAKLGMSITKYDVGKCEKTAEESSRSLPANTLFDPLPPPHLPSAGAGKGGRKQGREDAGHARQEGKEAAVTETGADATPGSSSSPLPRRSRLRSGK